MKAEEFDKAVSQGAIGPLYYLHGDEPYLVERAAKRLLDRVLSADFRDFNLNIFYGNECRGTEVIESAQTLPMFVERRVVLVRKSDALSTAALEIIGEYVENPCPSTCLIFQGGKIDQRKKFFSLLKKQDALVEFKRLFEGQVAAFIRSEVAGNGKKIEGAAVDFLGCLVGTNLQELVSQLEKLLVFAGERQTITLADVRQIVSDTKVDSVFELANALGERNAAKALRSLQTILRDGEAALMILAMVTRHFRQLWLVREQQSRRVPAAEISKATGINPYFLKGVIEQARNFDPADFTRIFESFYAADGVLKTGGGKQGGHVLECLVMDICRSR